MAPGLPMNRQKGRPSIQPVLPELSRLFKAHGSKKNVESSPAETSPSEFDQSAVESNETSEQANQTGSSELSSEAVIGQEDLNNTHSMEDKAVSTSTGERRFQILDECELTHNLSLTNWHSFCFDTSHPRTRRRSIKPLSRR